MEEIEQKLCLNNGKKVILIRLGYGTQSESLMGTLDVFTETYPIRFGVASLGVNVLFTVEDVKSLDENSDLVITLKGPKDYHA